MSDIKVDCVVVTYNRLELLKKCLKALLAQNFELNNIIIVDNNSSDGTTAFLERIKESNDKLKVIHLKENLGGAGGFNKGIKAFIEHSQSDYVWIMDDDTIPSETSLLELVKVIKSGEKFGFLASNDRWKDGSAAVMNVPVATSNWNEYIDKGLILIKSASFVSLLVPRDIILKLGLPISDFFIWGDDVEYTTRIFASGINNFFVPNSYVTHEMNTNSGTNIIKEKEKGRIKRYYFANRNSLYIKRKYESTHKFIKEFLRQIYLLFKIIVKSKNSTLTKLKFSFLGTCSGLFFNPRIEGITKKK